MSGFTKIPNEVFHTFCTAETQFVACGIVRMGDQRRWRPFKASQRYLADRFRVRRSVVESVLAELVDMGVVTIVERGSQRKAQVLRVNEPTGDISESSATFPATLPARSPATSPAINMEVATTVSTPAPPPSPPGPPPPSPPPSPPKVQTPDPDSRLRPQTKVSVRPPREAEPPPPSTATPSAAKQASKGMNARVDRVLDKWQELKKERKELGKRQAPGMGGRRIKPTSSSAGALRRCLKRESVESCLKVLEWAFHSSDSHAKFIRGERDVGQKANEWLTLSSLFAMGAEGELFGRKLEKAERWESQGRPGHPDARRHTPPPQPQPTTQRKPGTIGDQSAIYQQNLARRERFFAIKKAQEEAREAARLESQRKQEHVMQLLAEAAAARGRGAQC